MKLKEWKKFMAGVLAAGMLTSQAPVISQAEETQENNYASGENSEYSEYGQCETALDGDGNAAEISEIVKGLLEEGKAYFDETDGYLHDSVTGERISPVSGEPLESANGAQNGEESGEENSGEYVGEEENEEESSEENSEGNSGGNGGEGENIEESEEENSGGNGGAEGNAEKSEEENSGGNGGAEGNAEESEEENSGGNGGAETDAEESGSTYGSGTEADGNHVRNEGDGGISTNAELVASQKLVSLPVMVEDFRFWTVTRKYAFASENTVVREEMDDEARHIGELDEKGLCYILKEEENGWLYIESGTVRGFVKAEEVLTGDEAKPVFRRYERQAKREARRAEKEYTGIEAAAPMARELIPASENEAFTYLRATVNQTVVEKKYALCNTSGLNIREDKGTDSRIVGTLEKGGLCYILADEKEEWVYIESGDVRGFVKRDYLDTGDMVKSSVLLRGEEEYTAAKQLVAPEENEACYYTLTSVKSGIPDGGIRSSLIEYASQFIGNPYVWGGTSLTEGADCSGFVQSIYREYGYDLPRVSKDQAQYGTKIAVEDAQPGDLIFYAKDGKIYHVVIYAGGGKTIEAMDSAHGITVGTVNKTDAVWATHILEDTVQTYAGGSIGEVNATPEMYGESLGAFDITYYCACELCCGVETGITATGAPVAEGRTIAADPSVIPYGTEVIIGGHVFTAEDCGGAIKGNRIDIYVDSHQKALELGRNQAEVYLVR